MSDILPPERKKVRHSPAFAPMKPRVLIMIATDPIGGPGKGLFQFLKHFPRHAGDYVLCNFDLKNRPIGQFVQEARRTNLKLVLLNQRARIDPSLIFQARRIVRKNGINIVQTHGYKTHVIGMFLRVLCGTPWLGFAHGYQQGGWRIGLYSWLDRTVLRYADRIVTVSDSMRTLLMRHGIDGDKIRLIYNAVDLDVEPRTTPAEIKEQHGIGPGRKVIGVIGRLNPEKGQIVFLAAMKRVIERCPDVQALLIGDGPDCALLERYCLENGLADHVIFTGYRENMADYYQVLDLLVLPSLSEGLPNTVLEAMSFGIPVLATRVGGVPEIIGKDNGVMVPPGDPDALAKQIVELIQNDALRASIGAEGRRSLYPRFAPDQRARQILDVYDELLAGRPGTRASGHDG